MVSILIAITGAIIVGSILKKRKRRNRTVTSACLSARSQTQKPPQMDVEKERLKVCRDYNRRIKAELEKRQAADDIIHLEQRKADLLKAYDQLPDADSEKIIKRRIAYDNAVRATEKQIEKAYMILRRTY